MKPEATVEVKSSIVEGLGVFSARDVAAGEVIRRVNVVREVTGSEPLDEQRNETIEHCSVREGRLFLYGFPDRHVNHSCNPNAYYDEVQDVLVTRARRDIQAGDEVTVDYLINNAGGNSWPCDCGAARCRGETGVSFFTLPIEFQREYLPLLLPWFCAAYGQQLDELKTTL